MKHHIYEDDEGGCIKIAYLQKGEDNVFTFLDAHVLDAQYNPVGPNIAPLLQKMAMITDMYPDGTIGVKPFFSIIANEIVSGASAQRKARGNL